MARLQLLKGIRVVDLTHAHAGPFGTQILGDMGAEVIKIEAPNIGELTRVFYPTAGEGISYYYLALNRNKKSLALDLMTPSGKEAFYDLVKVSDVVIDNLRGGSLKRMGLDYDTIMKVNPRIISCSIYAYGPTGPLIEAPSNDDVSTALVGMYSLSGYSGEKPARPPVAIADISSGMYAAMAIGFALYERSFTGKGRRLELSLLDCVISFMQTHYQRYFLAGEIPKPQGAKHPTTPFVGVFETKDGYVGLGPCWPRIARIVDKEYLIDDPRFANTELRAKNKDALESEIEEVFKQHNTDQWIELLRAEDVPVGRVNNLKEALEEPQIIENKVVGTVKVGGKDLRIIDTPIKAKGAVQEKHLPPVKVGENTIQVFKEILGYSDAKIQEIFKEQEANAEILAERIRTGLSGH
ncbi:CaiB/BaiF CoA transferase family protein [Chloroflexota bacterium]